MIKKAKWFFDGNNLIFQNSQAKVKKFKNLEILQCKERFFQFSSGNNLLPYLNFLHIFCTENTIQENKKLNRHGLIQKPQVFTQKWEKMKIIFS